MYVKYILSFFRYAYFESSRNKCFTITNPYDNFVNTRESEGIVMVYGEKEINKYSAENIQITGL